VLSAAGTALAVTPAAANFVRTTAANHAASVRLHAKAPRFIEFTSENSDESAFNSHVCKIPATQPGSVSLSAWIRPARAPQPIFPPPAIDSETQPSWCASELSL
jgi:hypothetical protein